MKLKEKLANDYYQERPEGFGEPTNDFLAGFEKAREMASQEDFIYCGEAEQRQQSHIILEIGEEEVE